ncbi:sugar-binding protein [Streptomyces boninensis]|uniref:sugar-binding protein n=1 Tax=Streptomyces boninensis TaxID=2039455 RepID=UPI003B21B73C
MQRTRRTTPALIALLAVLLTLLTASPPATAAPLLSSTFPDWTRQTSGSVDADFAADTGTKHDGEAALKIVNNTARKPDTFAFLAQKVPVKPDTTYEFSAWTKSEGMPDLGLQITLSPDWSQRHTFPAGTYDWTKRTWTYTTKADQTTLDYRLLSQDKTTGFWLDGLTMAEQGTTANLLKNPGFEQHAPPNLITSPSLVFTTGQAKVQLKSAPDIAGPATWTVRDEQQRSVDTGSVRYTNGAATLDLTDLGPGYYHLEVSLDAGSEPSVTRTDFAVLAPAPSSTISPSSPFGVAVHLGDGNAMNAKLADLAQQAGISHARSDVYWDKVEKTKGQYTFPAGWDTDFKRFKDRGITPLPISTYRNPLYDSGKTPSTPEGLAAYAAYTSALADHYKDLTKSVEVYNEFNINFNDGACGRTPACYYDMLRTTAEKVKAANPDTKVAGPATAGLALDWVDELLRLGGTKHLDAVSVHPYRYPNTPEGIDDEMTALRNVIRSHNDGKDKPIWLTELGWPTNEGGGTSRLQQADYLVRAQAQALSHGAERFFWYELMESGTDPAEKEHHFGLLQWPGGGVTEALAPKEAFVTQAVMTRQLAGKKFAAKDDIAEPAYSYRFGDGADATRVMWAAPDRRAVTLRTDSPLKVTDAYGRAKTLTPNAGTVRLDLDQQPVFVTGPVRSVGAAEAPALKLSAPKKAATGDTVPVKLTVDRTGAAGAGLPQSLDVQVEGEKKRVKAPKGKVTTATFEAPAGSRLQDRHFVADVARGKRPLARLTASTTVARPVELSADPVVTAADPAAGKVEITLANNHLDKSLPVDDVAWKIGDTEGEKGDIADIPASSSRTVTVPLASVRPWDPYEQKITARLPGHDPLTVSGTTGFNPAQREGASGASAIDLGKQGEWSKYTEDWGGADDLSGPVKVAHTDDELVLTADVSDDAFAQDNPASTMYNGDSIQFALSPQLPGRSAQMTEIGLAKLKSGATAYTYMAAGAAQTGPTEGAKTEVTREGTVTSYKVRIPWKSLGLDARPDRPVALSMIVNDNDGKGRRGFLEWGSGVGRTKDTALFRPLQFME